MKFLKHKFILQLDKLKEMAQQKRNLQLYITFIYSILGVSYTCGMNKKDLCTE